MGLCITLAVKKTVQNDGFNMLLETSQYQQWTAGIMLKSDHCLQSKLRSKLG